MYEVILAQDLAMKSSILITNSFWILYPGAYKADLFRYCILFIHGGIYADVDVLLSTDLDKLLEDDIGFVVPVDEVRRHSFSFRYAFNL